MANEEALGLRKTVFVLVVVVGCFAMLWPRILSPLILGNQREQLKPNQYDRDAALKQERPLRTGVPHPAMLERGRAIPAGIPPPRPAPLPAHIRVWHTDTTVPSPLAGYYDIDIKPPPIPGMRPPMGAGAGGPAPPSKSPMGLLMPIYTICIVVFFVFTLSKLLFKRTSSPYEEITPDPHFRRRVFRDDSRQSPDKLVVTAISGLVAEVQQQMEASYVRNQQTQEAQDNLARPYTNGRVIHSGPVQIVASQYITPEPRSTEPSFHVTDPKVLEEPKEMAVQSKETLNRKDYKYAKEPSVDDIPVWQKESEVKEASAWQDLVKTSEEKPVPSWQFRKTPEPKEYSPELREESPEAEDLVEEEEELDPTEALIKLTKKVEEKTDNIAKLTGDFLREEEEKLKLSSQKSVEEQFADLLEEAMEEESHVKYVDDAIEDLDNGSVKVVGMEFLAHAADGGEWPNSGPPLAPSPTPPAHAHEAADVKSIFLETEIPTPSRVIVTDLAEGRASEPPVAKHSSLVVSGKMTLSLIQDAPRDTPERDLDSTLEDFTTASAFTQPAQKDDDLSEEEGDEVEEIEVEEVDEEVEEEAEAEEEEIEEYEAETKEDEEREQGIAIDDEQEPGVKEEDELDTKEEENEPKTKNSKEE